MDTFGTKILVKILIYRYFFISSPYSFKSFRNIELPLLMPVINILHVIK